MTDTVCVTGASGGIGQALLAQLVGRYHVKALFRSENGVVDRWQQRGCTVVWGDLADDRALADLVRGARYVFHCAAVVGGPFRAAHAVNVDGTRRLLRAAASGECERVVHLSSAAVYSAMARDAERVEAAPLYEHDGLSVYSRTKLQSERAVVEVAAETGLQYTILRPTCVYGPRTKSYTLVPLALIAKGLPVVIGDGRGLLDVVYVDDVAQAMIAAAESAAASGETFNIGHEAIAAGEFYAYYGRMVDRPVRHVPRWLVDGAAGVLKRIPGARDIGNGAAFLAYSAGNAQPFPSTKAARVFGYAPQTDLTTGMLATELWAKQSGVAARRQYAIEGYGPLPFRPLAVVHPARELDLVNAVTLAKEHHLTARAIGSLHSMCPIPQTEGVCLVLDRYNQLIGVDGELVTVQAGMTLRSLNEALAQHGLALPITGSIAAQTVSGAISTGTHGGSIYHGALSDYVEAVRIVRADGTVVSLERSEPRFDAAVVSLGLLGVMSTVTIRCVPAFVLQSRCTVRSADDVLDRFDEINREARYLDMLYHPIADQVEILSIDRVEGAAVPMPEVRVPSTAAKSGLGQRAVQRLVRGGAWLLHQARWNSAQRVLTGRIVGSSYKPRYGRSDTVLTFGDFASSEREPTLVQDMEVAIPYERAQAAIRALRDHFRRTGRYPLLPIHIRASAKSAQWLSPAYGQDVCWLEFWQYPRDERILREIHEVLKGFEYRFHWGKEMHADRLYIERQYERWADFARLRHEWDPSGVFMNGYLQAFFPAADAPAARVTRAEIRAAQVNPPVAR